MDWCEQCHTFGYCLLGAATGCMSAIVFAFERLIGFIWKLCVILRFALLSTTKDERRLFLVVCGPFLSWSGLVWHNISSWFGLGGRKIGAVLFPREELTVWILCLKIEKNALP